MVPEPASPPTPVVAVGAVVLRGAHLLMVQRGSAPAEGLWTLPGGRVEPGERLTDAVEREVREETGIEVMAGELLGVFEAISDDHHYVILDHFAAPTADDEPAPASDAVAARWVPLAEVASLALTPRLMEMLTAWGVLNP